MAREGRGKEAGLCYAGHLLVENRHGLIVECELTQATGSAEREGPACDCWPVGAPDVEEGA